MGKQRLKQPPSKRSMRRWAAFGILGLVAVVAAFWGFREPREAAGGTPRLVLDHDVVELGTLPFEAPARVVFTMTNTGEGPLRLADVPRVRALKGC